ncbi:MAG TPA: hypothetical protein DCP31_26655 [Cyanobacteria bacterium UBA8543]|nr:hypothetical protein [Cyanobacteria bacterium UBA8543]
MERELTPKWVLPPKWLRFLIIAILVLGIFFRFVNLDRKVYWCDETYTSLRIAGYTTEEVVQQVFNRKVIDVKALQKYQHPNSEKSVIDTINGLATEEPQHSPFYYVMARFWVQMFGSSVAVVRSLSALISLLTFPCIYWLCLELFGSPLTGWISIALISVSSLHILYAQEAREYSLWTVSILLASASLLRAMHKQTKLSWGIYAITLALSFYSFLFSIWMAIGHGFYVVLTEGFQLSKRVTSYLLASLVSILLFAPWFIVVLNNYKVYTSTVSIQRKLPLELLLQSWGRNLSFLFFDSQVFSAQVFSDKYPSNFWHLLTFVVCITLVLVGYSIYFLITKTPERIWLFILTLMVSAALPLVFIDLYLGWRLSSLSRYLIPSCLGIQLAVAYLITTKITDVYIKMWQQKLWKFFAIALISVGVLSSTVSTQAETAWTKGSYDNPQIARIVNQVKRPLLIGYSSAMCDIFSLSYLVNPNVNFLLLPIFPGSKLLIPNIPGNFSNVFLFDPHSAKFLYKFKGTDKNNIRMVYKSDNVKLWELKLY